MQNERPEASLVPQQSGSPKFLPYGRHWIDEDDIAAVVKVLRSDWLTTGPAVEEFEGAFAKQVEATEAVALSSGTAALHACVAALGIGPGDEVLVPAMTFAATANCVVYQGGTPVFVDVDPDTLLLNLDEVAARINPRTRAIIAVDYAGQACEYDELAAIARRHGVALIADACHSLGGAYRGRPVGSLADLTAFSLHPVKHITTGEGGVITTNDPAMASRIRRFRNHGINTDHRQRERAGSWYYEMVELGYNYRMTDIQCALGLSQLRKLGNWVSRRAQIAQMYDAALQPLPRVSPLVARPDRTHAYHLYVVRLDMLSAADERARVFTAMRSAGIGVNVHYLPVHLHPFYQQKFKTRQGDFPKAESAYQRILSLPIFPSMMDEDVTRVIGALRQVLENHRGSNAAA